MLQVEETECGAVCLGIVLAYFGRWVSVEALREACAVNRDGCDAADIARAARLYGLQPHGWRREPEQLLKMKMPLIIFWEFNHFLVLEGFQGRSYLLNDPANGHRVVDREEFDQGFTGVALSFEVGPEFQRGGARPGVWRRLWPWLSDVTGPLAFALACGLLLTIPALTLPFLLGIFVDHVLSGQEPQWAAAVIGGVVCAGALVYLLTWLRQRCFRLLAVRLSVDYADRFIRLLFRLSMRFFTNRFAGDLTSRVQLIDQIAVVATEQFVGVLIELVTSLVFLAFLFVYDPLLAAVVGTLGAANAVLMRLLTRSRVGENRRVQRERGKLYGVGMYGLATIDSLQAVGRENDFYAHWTGYQARELLARQHFAEIGHVMGVLPGVFMLLGNAVVLGVGGWRVMSGDLTLGMMMGFYVLAAHFLLPIGRFVQFADLFQILEANLQRLEDVLDAPEDASFQESREANPQGSAAFARAAAAHRTIGDAQRGVRLQGQPGTASEELQPDHRTRPACGRRRADRLGQVDAGVTGGRNPSAVVRRDTDRRPSSQRSPEASAHQLRVDGRPTHLPVHRHRAGKPDDCGTRRLPAKTWWPRPWTRTSIRRSSHGRRAMIRLSRRVGEISAAASGNAWRSPAPSSVIRLCCFWTRPPAPWTR